MSLTATDIFGRESLLVPGTLVVNRIMADPLRDPALPMNSELITARLSGPEDELWLATVTVVHGVPQRRDWPAKDVHFCDDHCHLCPRTDLREAIRLYRLCMRAIGSKWTKTKGWAPWSPKDQALHELGLTLRTIGAS